MYNEEAGYILHGTKNVRLNNCFFGRGIDLQVVQVIRTVKCSRFVSREVFINGS